MKIISIRLIVLIGAALLLLGGCDSSSSSGGNQTGTAQLGDTGVEVDGVYESGDPFPAPSADADRPEIIGYEWTQPESGKFVLIIDVVSPHPVTAIHFDVADTHLVFPTLYGQGDGITIDICNDAPEIAFSGLECTEACLTASACFQDCVVDGGLAGVNDTNFVQQSFAGACSLSDFGPGELFDSEMDYLRGFWLGEDENFPQSALESIPAVCDTSGCPGLIEGEPTTRVQVPAVEGPTFDPSNVLPAGIAARSQPADNSDRGTLTGDTFGTGDLNPCGPLPGGGTTTIPAC